MNRERQVAVASHFHANELSLLKADTNGKKNKKKSSSSEHKSSFGNVDGNEGEEEDEDVHEYMEVTILQAQDLPKADVFGSSDPYVVMKWEQDEDSDWDSEALLVTDVVMDNLNPIWGEGSGETTVIGVNPETPKKDLIFEVLFYFM
jgi:hypothetical protein